MSIAAEGYLIRGKIGGVRPTMRYKHANKTKQRGRWSVSSS